MRTELVEELAGREFSLWIIKDYRRKGALSIDALAVLRRHAGHKGVREFAERLVHLSPESVDALERAIRREPATKK